jgi:hypothetical protein
MIERSTLSLINYPKNLFFRLKAKALGPGGQQTPEARHPGLKIEPFSPESINSA